MPFKTGSDQNKFKDIDMSFELNPVTKDLKVVYDAEAVKQSLKKLIVTKKLWNFDNMNLNQLMFEDFRSILQNTVVLSQLEEKLKRYEPRTSYIKINASSIQTQNLIVLDIEFGIKTFIGESFNIRVFKRVR